MAETQASAPQARQTLSLLRAALAEPGLAPRVARNCERLVERLSRPVRVGLLGFVPQDRARLLAAILGQDPLPPGADWPTLEIAHADAPRSVATLADASRIAVDGLPGPDLLAMAPVFVSLAAPFEALRRMSFLHLAVGADPALQAPALAWAARRCDLAIWCSRGFGAAEAAVWAAAPDRLKHHAHLAILGQPDGAGADPAPPSADFQAVIALPGTETIAAGPLLARLEADIDAALAEDLDAARLLLHRFGLSDRPAPDAEAVPAEDGAADEAAATGAGLAAEPGAAVRGATVPAAAPPVVIPAPDPEADPAAADRIAILSEPIIFLRRRARNLFETLEWQDGATEGWVAEVLEQCCDTADGLRDRAADWPEDDPTIITLREMVDEASDMAVLLQVEGGRDQAQDAAAMLCQLRAAFEARLPAALPLAC